MINYFKKHKPAKWFAATVFFAYLAAMFDSIGNCGGFVTASIATAVIFFFIAASTSLDQY